MTPMHARDKLSYRLTRWVIVAALLAGAMLSMIQIILDAGRVKEQMNIDAQQILDVVRDSATQAVYSIDPELGQQVVEGLFREQEIRYASINHPDGNVLAVITRPATESSFRWLSDPIFGHELTYHTSLEKSDPELISFGELTIVIDTAFAARVFLERSWVIMVSGLIKAIIMGLILIYIYHVLLTKPLNLIINALHQVNPSDPGKMELPTPTTHERDELGLWVRTTNALLHSISSQESKRRKAEARVLELSQYDPLTGLPNRPLFRTQLESSLAEARNQNHRLAVLCCGIDDFKSINDEHNYSIGDRLLQEYARRLAQHNDRLNASSRLGGDQFALVQHDIGNEYQAALLAETLLNKLNEPYDIDGRQIRVHTTIGISIFPEDEEDTEKLLQKAEQTMTLAKNVSRNQFQFYVAEVDEEIRGRKKLEHDLNDAIENGEMFLVYQPQINYQKSEIVGAEALLRWKHPEHGFVPPDRFIPIAESNQSILAIGRWVLDEACKQARKWLDQGLDLNVAVNLSAKQLRDPNIVKLISTTLKNRNLPPEKLELEITETGFMENLADSVERLREIRNLGVSTSVDDFGTGYSSLSYLKRLPIGKLKIDKQFVRDLLVDEDDTRIVSAIIQLGKSLGLTVVAEGVETREQEAFLKEHDCEMAQGYYYSKPITPEEFEAFLKQPMDGLSLTS